MRPHASQKSKAARPQRNRRPRRGWSSVGKGSLLQVSVSAAHGEDRAVPPRRLEVRSVEASGISLPVMTRPPFQ